MPTDAPPRPGARRLWRHLAKVLHEVASLGYGGALAACLLINLRADRSSPAVFRAARELFAAIANGLLVPCMAGVVVSGLLALAATRGYLDAGWAWLKALLGLSVFEATLVVVGSAQRQAELLAAAPDQLDALLRAERHTLVLLIGLSIVNVVLAVWRPKLAWRVR